MNELQAPPRDILLYQMGRHVAPTKRGQQHRLLSAEVRKAPCPSRQVAIVASGG
jgi:hypothetical protein